MNQYMSDSSFTDFDPWDLTLDPAMQARDAQLITNLKSREAQLRKQSQQDEDILEELLNGGQINVPITVFLVGKTPYVVDGFHRTSAARQFHHERPEATMRIKALLVRNRSYAEAFLAAQDANQNHGVGVTKDEIAQSKFRALLVQGEFDLSVSQLQEHLKVSRGQAAHARKALEACNKALGEDASKPFKSACEFTELLSGRLRASYDLPPSAFDSNDFPKIRKLSDAVSGKDLMSDVDDGEDWIKARTETASEDITRLINNYGEGVFREALRKSVRGRELGVSVTRRDKWESHSGYSSEDDLPENWRSSDPTEDTDSDF